MVDVPKSEMAVARRTLRFSSLNEVLADVDRLATEGYTPIGRWNLSQVAGHLADWCTFPVSGFPAAPAPIALILWMLKKTIGRRKLLGILASGEMPAGKPTMPKTVHPADEDPGPQIERLRKAANEFSTHIGEYHPSPLFGPLERVEAMQLQLVHCSHHLSFLLPSNNPSHGVESVQHYGEVGG